MRTLFFNKHENFTEEEQWKLNKLPGNKAGINF